MSTIKWKNNKWGQPGFWVASNEAKENNMSTTQTKKKSKKNIQQVLNPKGDVVKASKNTYVAIVLDRSGSMNSLRDSTIEAMNKQIATIKAWPEQVRKDTKITFTVFNGTVNVSLINRPIDSLVEINRNDYVPDGSTALNDAIVETLETLEKTVDMNDEDSDFLVLVFTDGDENASRRYPKYKTNEVKAMVDKRRDTRRWIFTYIGTEDLQTIEDIYGITADNSVNYIADQIGTTYAASNMSRGLSSYGMNKLGGEVKTCSFYNNSNDDPRLVNTVQPSTTDNKTN